MQIRNRKIMFAVLALAAVSAMVLAASPAAVSAAAAGGGIQWKDNFGGSEFDCFEAVAAASDGGVVAAGYATETSFGNGDWSGAVAKGSDDAIIVKFDADGNIVWKKNFGGSGDDSFYGVTAVSGGYVAVGTSDGTSFGTGDWAGISGKGSTDAIVVKFDPNGNVVWKKNFGGSGADSFSSVASASGGSFVAAGYSFPASFGNGDWTGIQGNGEEDAVIVKFDADGNIVWNKNFGGSGYEYFTSVAATADGCFAAAGYAFINAAGSGDWKGVTGKGDNDAVIVKFDADGNIVWNKNFGGPDDDRFMAVAASSDGGAVAAGHSGELSFGSGDWAGIRGNGEEDAVIVKFDADGNIVWNKNFGGKSYDYFSSVTAARDGSFVAGGYSYPTSFGSGDWAGIRGNGGYDAVIVKFGADGNVIWNDNFGGLGGDHFYGITAVSDGGLVASGDSDKRSFQSRDWIDAAGKGEGDAIVVKYDLGSDPGSGMWLWAAVIAVIAAAAIAAVLLLRRKKS